MKVYEIKKDIRDGNYDIIRDSCNLEKIIENINFNVQCITEINHLDFDYVITAMSKAVTLLANVNYILENHINNDKNYTLQERIELLNEKLKIK
ncbi:MAG: hypothetical protein HFJ45_00005 [Clostridia bacterium]|nr:hypothetical protein [Clostridia bacterium]